MGVLMDRVRQKNVQNKQEILFKMLGQRMCWDPVRPNSLYTKPALHRTVVQQKERLAATLRWFTAGGAIRIAVRQLSQTWKLRHYDVIDDVITRKL